MPGDPYVIGEPAMCVDAASLQWFADAKAHKPRPNDTTSPAIRVGPHWMIMWPFDPKTTGLPTTHRDHGAYIMWAGSPYAHMHVMGRP
jgi:hypothetical protein